MNLTKREFEIISLYARGLTFKEMGHCLNVAERTAISYFMRVKAKDKSRISRAKKSRAINKQSYRPRLKEVLRNTRAYNQELKQYHIPIKEISLQDQERVMRYEYLQESLLFAFKSWHKFKLKNAKLLQ